MLHGSTVVLPVAELDDVPALPWRFHGSVVVVLPDVRHGAVGWYSVEHGQAGERSAGPAATPAAGDLDTRLSRASPDLDKGGAGGNTVAGEPEVRPPKPATRPRCRRRLPSQKVEPEVGRRAAGKRRAQSSTSDEADARQGQDPVAGRVPAVAGTTVSQTSAGSRVEPPRPRPPGHSSKRTWSRWAPGERPPTPRGRRLRRRWARRSGRSTRPSCLAGAGPQADWGCRSRPRSR